MSALNVAGVVFLLLGVYSFVGIFAPRFAPLKMKYTHAPVSRGLRCAFGLAFVSAGTAILLPGFSPYWREILIAVAALGWAGVFFIK